YQPSGCPAPMRCFQGTSGARSVFFAQHSAAGRRMQMVEDRAGTGTNTTWNYQYSPAGELTSVLKNGSTINDFPHDHDERRFRKRYFHNPGIAGSNTTTTYYLQPEYELRVSTTDPGAEAVTKHLAFPGIGRVITVTSGGTLAGQPTSAAVAAAVG